LSEVMTIVVSFHQSGYRTFKDYFRRYVRPYLRWAFPQVVSYTRFVELMPQTLVPRCAYLQTCKGRSEGVAFIDSTLLAVCHPKRSGRHKVVAGLARWGRNSLGWCYGFKLHLLINDVGELLTCRLTAANVDDRSPVPALVAKVQGKVVGDRGYISEAKAYELGSRGVYVLTGIRKNMRKLASPFQLARLQARHRIEELLNSSSAPSGWSAPPIAPPMPCRSTCLSASSPIRSINTCSPNPFCRESRRYCRDCRSSTARPHSPCRRITLFTPPVSRKMWLKISRRHDL
jgi:hypothetical protein